MTDSYLAIANIADDPAMNKRMNAAVAQQVQLGNLKLDQLGNAYNMAAWVTDRRYVWASSPGWGEKWDYAVLSHENNPDYQPGEDPAVITDGDILSAVQALSPSSAVKPKKTSPPIVPPNPTSAK
jgi:hypothetical protein